MIFAVLILSAVLIGWVGTAVSAARLHRRLRTDPLTGLGNRAALRSFFDRASLPIGRGMAVLMLDLDGFKAINDTWGHRFGDAVLTEIAERLGSHERRGQRAVRLSGDEFAFWVGPFEETPANWQAVDALARDIARSIAESIVIDGQTLHVTASIGTATTTVKPDSLEGFLDLADRAMYHDKGRRAVGRRLSGKGA